MIRARFDIQKVYVDGANLYYQVYYKYDSQYVKLSDERFTTRAAANEYIDQLLDD